MPQMAPVMTIDGPSGAGKGTLCQLLAEKLGWHLLDSGAIYRVLSLAALHHDVEAVAGLALVEDHPAAGERDDLEAAEDGVHRVFREPLEEPRLGQHLVHCTSFPTAVRRAHRSRVRRRV